MVQEIAGDREPEIHLSAIISNDGPLREVEDDRLVVRLNLDRSADAVADTRTERHERLQPGLQLRYQVAPGSNPRCLLGCNDRGHVGCVSPQIHLFICKDILHRQIALQVLHVEDAISVELADAPWEHENCRLTLSLKALNHEALVGEDRILSVVHVVPAEELVIEEAGGSRRGDHHTGRDDLHVAGGSGELRSAFLLREGLSRLRRHVVDHWVPDRTAELQQADVDRSLHEEAVGVCGAAVIEVQEALHTVVDQQRGITDWAVCRGRQGLYDDAETAVLHRDARRSLDELVESKPLQSLLEL